MADIAASDAVTTRSGDSVVQREAEPLMVAWLGSHLGLNRPGSDGDSEEMSGPWIGEHDPPQRTRRRREPPSSQCVW